MTQKRGSAAAKIAALTISTHALYATLQRQYMLTHGPITWALKQLLRYLFNE